MACDPVEIREHTASVNPNFIQSLLNRLALLSRNQELIDFRIGERLCRVRMNCEDSRLHGYSDCCVVGNDSGHSINFVWIWVPLNLKVSVASISIDRTIPVVFLENGKVGCDKRITGPIEQARWQAVMLRNRKPLPVIIWRAV